MASHSSSDVGQYDSIQCNDPNELKAFKDLFIGNEDDHRWVGVPNDNEEGKEYFVCSFAGGGCAMQMVVCNRELSIKVTKGQHCGHGSTVDEGVKNVLHFFDN